MLREYQVVEIFPTLQGEGTWAGRRAVFVRLAGCNMWDGKPEHRARGQGACAMWCDTYFAKGQPMSYAEILARMEAAWQVGSDKMVVITGGEPTLQMDIALVKAMKHEGWYVACETNGTRDSDALEIVDHVCVSPKRGSVLQVWIAEELKVVLPGCVPGAPPEMRWSESELLGIAAQGQWDRKYVQPQDVTDPTTVEVTALTRMRSMREIGPTAAGQMFQRNVDECVAWVHAHSDWRLSLQQHKYIGLR